MQSVSGSHPVDRLREVWSRRKWLALAIFSLTAAVGVTVALSLPNIYRGTATVLVEQAWAEAAGSAELESRLQLISQEILSRSRLEALIRGMGLYPGLRQRASTEVVVGQMRRDIQTESKLQPQPSGIGATIAFAISYRGTDPQVVARVANALASLYLEEELRIRGRQASGAVTTLKAQLEDVKRDLQDQERALGKFQDQHMGELPQQADATIANLARLNADLRTASEERMRALDRRNELLKELAEADTGAAAVGTGPGPTAAKLAKKKEELADLRQHYSEKYPDVIRLKEEVAALERQASEADRVSPPDPAAAGTAGASGRAAARLHQTLQELEGMISGLKSDEMSLRSQIAEQIRRLENAPRRQQDYQQVARDYQTTRELYDSLRKRYEQAQLAEGDPGRPASSPFRILDSALPPPGPIAPNRPVLLFMALVAALAMAAAGAALAERIDTSLHTVDDIHSFTRVPVVASIPLIVTAGDLRSRRRRFCLAAVSLLFGVGLVVHTVHDMARTSDLLVSILAKGRS